MTLRPPPVAADLDPLLLDVPAGTVIFRVHALHREATAFNPGDGEPSRFAPLRAGNPAALVPTLYASATIRGAFSESIFHDVPYRGAAKRILVSRIGGAVLSALRLTRTVHVAQVAGAGLRRLGVRRRDLIETAPGRYGETVRWAAALHDCPVAPEGLTWTSRQDDTAWAFLLFGDRVGSSDLEALSETLALNVAPGLDLVDQAATEAGITVVR